MIDTTVLYILILVQLTLTLIQVHWSARKQKIMHQLSHSFQLVWMEFDLLLRLFEMMNFILSLSDPLNIQGREPYLYDFMKKNFVEGHA